MPALLNISLVTELRVTFTPHDVTFSDSLLAMLFIAMCEPTREDEHAVSIARQMPCRLNVYDMRPHATERAPPVAVYALTTSAILAYSLLDMPTVTPERSDPTEAMPNLTSSAASRSMRCCGSRRRPSVNDILNKSRSKASIPTIKLPKRA